MARDDKDVQLALVVHTIMHGTAKKETMERRA